MAKRQKTLLVRTIMKLKIFPYNKEFKKKFEKEKKRISKIIKDCEIYHIGSTAVPRLGGKGIIDIMIGIRSWKESKEIVKKLEKLDFIHVHPKEKGRIFLSKNKSLSLSNIHVHIAKIESKVYKELLVFRNYLRKNKKEAERFYKLKLKWSKESIGARKEYNKLKEKYIKEILKPMN